MTQVFVEPSHDLPLVSVLVAFRSGAVHDAEERQGLARVTARMIRRGAEGLSADAIEDRVDRLGGELSTGASHTATSVHFEVLRRSLEPFAELMATLLATPTFDQNELGRLLRETEAGIIEARDSDSSLASRAFRATLFPGHPYGRRVSGTVASVRAIERGDVAQRYKAHFTRENAIVAISGDIDADEGALLSDRLLAGLAQGEPVADPVVEPPRVKGRHLVIVDKPDRTQTQMVIGGLSTHATDPDHFPLIVANTAFGGTFTSRLMQEVRAKRGLSYGASSRLSFDRKRDAFTMWTAPKATDAAACLTLQLELLHTWIEDGITEDELSFVKSYLIRSHAFEIDTAKKRVGQRVEAALLDLPPGYHDLYVERIRAVTLREANDAVRARISEEDLVIGTVATNEVIGEALRAAIPRLASTTVVPFDQD